MTPTFYQVLSRNNDANGNPCRLVLLYNSDGSVDKAIEIRQSPVGYFIRSEYPDIKELPSFHLTPKEYTNTKNSFLYSNKLYFAA